MQLDDTNSGMGALATAQPDAQPTAPAQAQPADTSAGVATMQNPSGAQPADFGRNPLMAYKMIGSGALRLGQATKNLGSKIASALDTTPINGQPGSWARSVVAAGQKAMAGLGDVDTAPTQEGGGAAFLEGMARTSANARERQQKEQQTKFSQDIESQKLQLEKDRTSAEVAMNQMNMYHTQMMIHQMGEKSILDDINQDTPEFNHLLSQGAEKVAGLQNVSGAQLMKAGYNPDKPDQSLLGQQYQIFHTGRRVVGKDKEGNDQHESTYSVVKLPDTITLSKDQAKHYSDNANDGNTYVEGQKVPWLAYQTLDTRANSNAATKLAWQENANKLLGAQDASKVHDLVIDSQFQDAMKTAITQATLKGRQETGYAIADPEDVYDNLIKNPAVKGNEAYLKQALIDSLGGKDVYDHMSTKYEDAMKDHLGAERFNQLQDRQDKNQQATAYNQALQLIRTSVQSRNALSMPTRRIDAANQASRLMADSYNPATKQFDVNSMNYNELAASVAQLLTAGNVATQEQINGIKADTAYGRLQQMSQFWSGAPKNAAPQQLLQFIQRTIDREADEAEKTRMADWNGFIVPQIQDHPVLSEQNKQKLLTDLTGSGLRPYESIADRIKGKDGKTSPSGLPDGVPNGSGIVPSNQGPYWVKADGTPIRKATDQENSQWGVKAPVRQ
jgi:hypothetical protein